ncbi:unnamed protein product [Lepidochelys kempii]
MDRTLHLSEDSSGTWIAVPNGRALGGLRSSERSLPEPGPSWRRPASRDLPCPARGSGCEPGSGCGVSPSCWRDVGTSRLRAVRRCDGARPGRAAEGRVCQGVRGAEAVLRPGGKEDNEVKALVTMQGGLESRFTVPGWCLSSYNQVVPGQKNLHNLELDQKEMGA